MRPYAYFYVCIYVWNACQYLQHDYLLPTHSRTSSSASSVGSSYVSSSDSNKASSPSKSSSPVHSRQSSKSNENDKNIINSTYHHHQEPVAAMLPQQYQTKLNEEIRQLRRPSVDHTDNHGTTTSPESIYGTIRPHNKKRADDEFNYKTLSGSVIKSVFPPGKASPGSYKVFSS